MNAEQFVLAIRKYVADSVIKSTPEVLATPPGRSPAAQLVKNSQWYNALDIYDQEQVIAIAAQAVHDAMFSFMCVLDGASVIDEEHSEFHLFCINPQNGASEQLSGSEESDSLHELYKALDLGL